MTVLPAVRGYLREGVFTATRDVDDDEEEDWGEDFEDWWEDGE